MHMLSEVVYRHVLIECIGVHPILSQRKKGIHHDGRHVGDRLTDMPVSNCQVMFKQGQTRRTEPKEVVLKMA